MMTFPFLPISGNSMYSGRRFLTKKAKEQKEEIAWTARSQYKGKPLDMPLEASVWLYAPSKRRFDIDNTKGLLDSLTGICWLDDSLIYELHVYKRFDPANPRIEIELSTLKDLQNQQKEVE